MAEPLTTTSPEVGRSIPAIMLSRVDLPLPDLPITATNSPGSTCRSISWSAVNVPAAVSKVFVTPRRSIKGPCAGGFSRLGPGRFICCSQSLGRLSFGPQEGRDEHAVANDVQAKHRQKSRNGYCVRLSHQ